MGGGSGNGCPQAATNLLYDGGLPELAALEGVKCVKSLQGEITDLQFDPQE
jgi:hypothetical protein